jgi:AraC family transcriptional regulator
MQEIASRDYDVFEQRYVPGLTANFGVTTDGYFCFVTDGALSDADKSQRFAYSGVNLLFFPPNQARTCGFDESSMCLVVRVGPGMLSRVRLELQDRSPIHIQGWEALWLIRKLQSEFLKESDSGSLIMEAIILQLLVITARCSREEPKSSTRAWLSNIRSVIEDRYLNEFRLSELAALAGVHRVHLVREFRKHYGVTIGQYIRKLRIDHACQLLGQTNLPLREISSTCCFADQSHFTKQFRKLSGLTPAAYRDLVKGAEIVSRPSIHHEQFGKDAHIRVSV